MLLDRLLRAVFPHKEIGWTDIGERFTRYRLVRTRFFTVFLHQLDAPQWHPQCHDHPWWFVSLIIWGGYYEATPDGRVVRRRAGSVLYRPAEFAHNVVTRGVCWSVIVTGRRRRQWGFLECGRDN